MPIYEYKCTRCGKEKEVMQKYKDPPPFCDCDKEKPVPMRRQISQSSFRLKGTGWYKTDYSGK